MFRILIKSLILLSMGAQVPVHAEEVPILCSIYLEKSLVDIGDSPREAKQIQNYLDSRPEEGVKACFNYDLKRTTISLISRPWSDPLGLCNYYESEQFAWLPDRPIEPPQEAIEKISFPMRSGVATTGLRYIALSEKLACPKQDSKAYVRISGVTNDVALFILRSWLTAISSPEWFEKSLHALKERRFSIPKSVLIADRQSMHLTSIAREEYEGGWIDRLLSSKKYAYKLDVGAANRQHYRLVVDESGINAGNFKIVDAQIVLH